MGHEIENGEIALARKPAWHNLGTVLENTFTWRQGLKAAKMEWAVEKRQLVDPVTKQPVQAWATFRSDTGAMLGQVGPDYEPIQNSAIGEVLDAIVGQQDGAHYEVIGALNGGKRAWALVNLKEAIRIKGTDDVTNVYLLGMNAHDGTMSNRYYTTGVRVVCANTWRMAEAAQANRMEYRIRHTGEVSEKINLAKQVFTSVVKDTKEVNARLNRLAEIQVGKDTLQKILKDMFPRIVDSADGTVEHSEVQRNRARSILELFEHNDNNAFPKVRGTAYNLFNAVTEYVDHGKIDAQGTLTQEKVIKLANTAVLGSGENFKGRALDLICNAVNLNPVDTILNSVAM